MLYSTQGFGHFYDGLNNQDFGIELPRTLLVLDGCSAAKFSEIGTRLFAQLFSRKEECDKLEKFENNVKEVFDDIIAIMEKYYSNQKEFEDNFIMENLLFTILACFETDDKYIVKMFGDGYIITQNVEGVVSYIRFNYGKCPPYFAYKYCNDMPYQDYEFKTFEFDKKIFKRVGIATDGIQPIVANGKKTQDNFICDGNENLIKNYIRTHEEQFYDDITIALFTGGK